MADGEESRRLAAFSTMFHPLFPSAQNTGNQGNGSVKDAGRDEATNWLSNTSFKVDISTLVQPEKSSEKASIVPEKELTPEKEKPAKKRRRRSKSKSPNRKVPIATKSVFIEDTGLTPQRAYRVDRKPDGNNLAFTTFYHLNVAKYFRGIHCLGCGNNRQPGDRKKTRKNRYWSLRNLKFIYETKVNREAPTVKEYISLGAAPGNVRHLIYDTATSAYLAGKGPPSNISNLKEEGKERGKVSVVAKRVIELGKAVRDRPDDVEAWMELVKVQDEVDLGCEGTKVLEKTVLEKKLAVLDRAVETNPRCVELVTSRLELCGELWDTDKLMAEWKKVLFLQPNNADLWARYLNFLRTRFSWFSVSKFYKEFAKCIRMLNKICEGTFVSHAATPDLEERMLDIVCDVCHVLRQCGYGERALAIFQALVEFNEFTPANVSPNASLEERLAFFEPFWDSGAPRFGDIGARGWAAVLRDKNAAPEDATDDEISNEDNLVDVEDTRTENWLRMERAREERHWLPWRSSADCEDPERTVLFEDIQPALFLIREPKNHLKLLKGFLEFLGVESSPHLSVDCAATRCHGPSRLQTLSDATGGNHIKWDFANNSARDWEKDMDPPALGPSGECKNAFKEEVFRQAVNLLEGKDRRDVRLMEVELKCRVRDRRMKKKANAALKNVKGLLEQVENRNDLAMWTEYGVLEWTVGRESKAGKVFDTILGSRGGFEVSEDPDDRCQVDLVRMYRVYAQLKAGGHEPEGSAEAVWILSHLGAGQEYMVKKVAGEQTPSTLMLRAKRRYAVYQESFADSYCARHGQATDVLGELMVEWTACHAWFTYWTADAEEAFAVYGRLLERLELVSPNPKCSRYIEKLYFDNLRLLVFDNNHTVARPVRSVRATLQKALSLFPGNRHFLRLLLDVESKSHLVGRLRAFFNRTLKEHGTNGSGCTLAAFALCSEMDRLHVLRTAIFDRMEGICETGIVHRIRALFEKTLRLAANCSCVMLWRAYMRFEVQRGKVKNAKAVFYRAVQNCPWAKVLYVDAVEHFPNDLQEMMDLMTEKDIRIRTPVEEVDLLMESAKNAAEVESQQMEQ